MDNLLYILISEIEKIQLDIRENTCKECRWSVATFYRRLRIPKNCSNIETNFILDEIQRILINTLNRNEKICNVQNVQIIKRNILPIIQENNIRVLYKSIVNLPDIFKKAILEECNWSLPTLKRKKAHCDLYISNDKMGRIVALFNSILNSALAQTESVHKHLYQHRSINK
jgi:hypothetical protein